MALALNYLLRTLVGGWFVICLGAFIYLNEPLKGNNKIIAYISLALMCFLVGQGLESL